MLAHQREDLRLTCRHPGAECPHALSVPLAGVSVPGVGSRNPWSSRMSRHATSRDLRRNTTDQPTLERRCPA
jgi:hypothetical protein